MQEGVHRAATLNALARAVWARRPKSAFEPYRREALELLRRAESTARNEQDAALRKQIRAIRTKIERRSK